MDSVSGFSTIKCEVIWPLESTLMRTSMRPRSAGSSRISKLLLPFLADAAISTASPLNGTVALVAAVAVRGPAGARLVDARGSCAEKFPWACTLPSAEAVTGCSVVVVAG